MNHFFKSFSLVGLLVLTGGLTACETSGDVGIRTGTSAAQPRVATWRCTDAISSQRITLTITNNGSSLLVSDSRGIDAELPADPPGQRERYGKTGFALVFEGRNASWFASGKRPADCRR